MFLLQKSSKTVPWKFSNIIRVIASSIVLSIVFFILLLIVLETTGLKLSDNTRFAFFGMLAYFSLFIVLWKFIFKKYPNVTSAIGLRRVSWKAMLRMFPTAIVLMGINIIVFTATTTVFGEIKVKDTDLLLNNTLKGNEYLLVFIVTVVLAPIAEELLFRGLLYRYLRRKVPIIVAVLISAAVFGILHIVFPPLFVMGIVFALVSEKYDSLYPSMFLHAINNSIVFLTFYLGKNS